MDFNNLYNIEYEKIILGMLLLDNSIITLVQGKLPKESFYDEKTRFLYSKILEQWSKEKYVNILSLSSTLKNFDTNYIAELTDLTATSANWEFYVNQIQKFYITRCYKLELAKELKNAEPLNISNEINNFASKLSGFLQESQTGVELKNLCIDIPNEIEKAFRENKQYLGFETGFTELDDILDGFQTSQMYVIGARPSIGKTAFALNIARRVCERKVACTYFSLEMSCKQVFYRLLASVSRLPMWQLKKGTCMNYKQGVLKIMNGCRTLYDMNMNIVDSGVNTDEELLSKIRYEALVKNRKVFIVDHLGLVQIAKPSANHYLDVGRITSALHKLAKELDVCIILLCQMNREAEGKKPNLSLIRESGNIEQDSDVIMFLYRERNIEEDNVPTQIIVEKNRDGKTGVANFIFDKQTQNFIENKNNNEVSDVPKVPVENSKSSESKVEYDVAKQNEIPF